MPDAIRRDNGAIDRTKSQRRRLIAALVVIIAAVSVLLYEGPAAAPDEVGGVDRSGGASIEAVTGRVGIEDAPETVLPTDASPSEDDADSRAEVEHRVFVRRADDKSPLPGAAVEFVDRDGEVLETRHADGRGHVDLPKRAFAGLVVYREGFGIVGGGPSDLTVDLPPMPSMRVHLLAPSWFLEDFDATVSIEHYTTGTRVSEWEAACCDRLEWLSTERVEALAVALPNPVRSAGVVKCRGVHRHSGVELDLGEARFGAGADAVTIDMQRRIGKNRDWVGVRLHLPITVRGRAEARLLAASGKGGHLRGSVTADQPTVDIAAVGSSATQGVLLSVRVGDATAEVYADELLIDLEPNQYVDLAPWQGRGMVDVELVGVSHEHAKDAQVQVRRVHEDERVYGAVAHSRERLGPRHWRIGCLMPGAISLRVDGLGKRYRVESHQLEVRENWSGTVRLEATAVEVDEAEESRREWGPRRSLR